MEVAISVIASILFWGGNGTSDIERRIVMAFKEIPWIGLLILIQLEIFPDEEIFFCIARAFLWFGGAYWATLPLAQVREESSLSIFKIFLGFAVFPSLWWISRSTYLPIMMFDPSSCLTWFSMIAFVRYALSVFSDSSAKATASLEQEFVLFLLPFALDSLLSDRGRSVQSMAYCWGFAGLVAFVPSLLSFWRQDFPRIPSPYLLLGFVLYANQKKPEDSLFQIGSALVLGTLLVLIFLLFKPKDDYVPSLLLGSIFAFYLPLIQSNPKELPYSLPIMLGVQTIALLTLLLISLLITYLLIQIRKRMDIPEQVS